VTLNDARPGAGLEPDSPDFIALQDLLSCLSGKWVPAVLVALSSGPKRNFQLRQGARGISAKSLSEVLRRLCRDGFVAQSLHSDGVGNVGVGYHLTDLGWSAVGLLGEVQSWVSIHNRDVEESRRNDGHRQVS
jgi:DNA-binding HxlR family transcriptional regulator